MPSETIVRTIAEYIEFVDSVPAINDKEPKTYKSELVFRGQGSVEYELLPSIARDGWCKLPWWDEPQHYPGSLEHEADFVESACRMMPGVFNRDMLPIDLLACLQHYGIPTRLLDVTTNALAALYFACGNEEKDGEVFVFRRPCWDRREYPVCQAIADSWRLFMNSKSLDEYAALAISRPYFDYQRNLALRTCPDATSQANWFKKCCEEPAFVYGTRYLDRQTAQSGEYILFPNEIRGDGEYMMFADSISPLAKDGSLIAGCCVVPAANKRMILAGLRKLGVAGGGSLFPDSVERVCAEMVDAIKRSL